MPLGRLANSELRKLKNKAHCVFDPLWLNGGMTRTAAYTWLAEQLGIPFRDCHIGLFDEDLCRMTIIAVSCRESLMEEAHGCHA